MIHPNTLLSTSPWRSPMAMMILARVRRSSLHPAIRRRAEVARAAVGSDLAGTHLTRRGGRVARPELVGDIERALQLDLGSLSDLVCRAALTHTRPSAAITLP